MNILHFSRDRLSPDSLPSPDAVAALRSHPRFPDSARQMMSGIIGIYQGNRLLNQVMNDRGRVVFGILALHLHYARRPGDPANGLTTSRMKSLCAETGLCSPGRAAAMLLLMRYAGYLTPAESEADRRTRLLVPTERMINSQRERIRCHFDAMALLMQEGADGLALLPREDFIAAMAHRFGEAFCSGFRILDSSPILYPLAERNAGMMILFSLFLATPPDEASLSAHSVPISISALSRRFGVSRPHVLKLIRDAEALGFVRRRGESEQVVILPPLLNAMQDFVATMFLFLGQCVRKSLEEIH
jgi:DNA-binding MarR family transcriptional regulator